MILNYEYNWCEYLTPCKFRKDVFVGDYECENCKFFKKHIQSKVKEFAIGDYKRYININNGEIECNHK